MCDATYLVEGTEGILLHLIACMDKTQRTIFLSLYEVRTSTIGGNPQITLLIFVKVVYLIGTEGIGIIVVDIPSLLAIINDKHSVITRTYIYSSL